MRNVIESSKGKEPAATPNRSRAPFQGAHSLKSIKKHLKRQIIFLSPTLPPLAPVRPCPYAGAGARSAGQLAAPPSPPSGGAKLPCNTPRTKKHPMSLAGTLSGPLLSATREPAPSLPFARASRSGSVLRSVALRYGSSPSRHALRYPLMLQRNGG